MRLDTSSVAETVLFGHELEIGVINRLLDDVGEHGSVMLIRGDPGVGKSTILGAAKSLAGEREMSILTATGVQSEMNLPFAGLYELLRPILNRLDRLPGPQQNALRAALGLSDGPGVDLFHIALGALDLLAEFASERPLLLVVDDVMWLDASSINVLAFIARRLESEPIVLLIAGRDHPETPLADMIPELRIEGLKDHAARALLDAVYPNLRPDYRQRVLEESGGNPLALLELPKAIDNQHAPGPLLPEASPLTTRLERAFAERISSLPCSTRSLLLIAALHDGSSIAEVISAARLLDGVESSLDALTPAVTAGLVHVDTARLSFRHPLARSAVFHASSLSERVAAHNALATVLTDPDARVWHRAAATVGVDEALAEELEGAAMRAQQRGDLRVAIQALDRAVQISEDTTRIARRLLKAAELAFFIGWPETVADLLERAEKLDLSPRDRLKLSCYRVATNGSGSGPHVLVEIADKIRTKEDVNIALDLFTGPGFTWWMLVADAEISRYVISAIESVPGLVSDDDPRFLLLVAVTAPMDRGRFVIERLRNLRQSFSGREDEASLLGGAAIAVGDLETAEHFLSRSAAALRSEGQLLRLTRVLLARAQTAMYFGNIDVAIADAEEGERLAEETRQPPWAAYGQTVTATLAALRGEHELAEAKAAIAAKAIRAPGITASNVAIAQGMNELTARRYENAYAHFQRLFDPTHAAYHQMKGCFYIGDLAEAAVQSGHADEARAILAEMEALSQQTPSPQFHAAMHYARAVLARDTEAERLFETALAADVMRSPFMRARLRLAFGIWLRRAHRPREARSLLQRALEQFDALDAVPWRERTRHELRNAGVVPHRRAPDRRDQLTQRELEIALMAAEGLSNHEIGQKLYLSRRTIGSHLHRLFPKLQITSRRQLREVLGRGHLAT